MALPISVYYPLAHTFRMRIIKIPPRGNQVTMALNPAQRKFLRSVAHHLDPLVLIGKHGLTDALVKAAGEVLEAHELIKVRFNDFKSEKKELAEKIAFRTGSDIVGIIGHVAILYKYQRDDDKRKIEVPES